MTAAVHTIANSVTPPEPERRRGRYQLREAAAACLPDFRVARCGRYPNAGGVTVRRSEEGGAGFAGLETCGSIWHCPVCANKIAAKRREEVGAVIDAHIEAGGAVYMASLTMPHTRFDDLPALLDAVRGSWRRLQAGAPWTRAKARFGIVGTIRALEVTHGGNGWHPHIHVLLLTGRELPDAKAEALSEFLLDRWSTRIERAGFGACSAAGFDFRRAWSSDGAGDYVSKWGADAEIAFAAVKKSSRGGRTPFQILADAEAGDQRSRWLFRQYGQAFHGARHLTWSKGLRARYLGSEDEEADEDIAAAEPEGEVLGVIDAKVFRRIAFDGRQADVLAAAESGGWPAVLEIIRGYEHVRHSERRRPKPARQYRCGD